MSRKSRLSEVNRFIGRRSFFWVGLCLVGSLSLTGVELLLALTIQIFLKSIGVMESEINTMGLAIPTDLNYVAMSGLLVAVGGFRFCSQFIVRLSSVQATEVQKARLKVSLMHSVLEKSDRSYRSAAQVHHFFSDVVTRTASGFTNLMIMLSQGLQAIGLLALMIFAAWKESLAAFFLLGIAGLLVKQVTKQIVALSFDFPEKQKSILSGIQKTINSWLFLRITKSEKYAATLTKNEILHFSNRWGHVEIYRTLNQSLASFVGILLIVCLVLLSRTFWSTPGTNLLTFLYLLVRFSAVLTNCIHMSDNLKIEIPFIKIAFDFFKTYSEKEWDEAIAPISRLPLIPVRRLSDRHSIPILNPLSTRGKPPRVSCQGLRYSYSKSDIIFSGLDFDLHAGSQLGIVGESGPGKTTLLHLILGLLEPGDGSILLNEESPKDFFENEENVIGYVGPDSFIIEGAVYLNLC